jgi:hypothetical protein
MRPAPCFLVGAERSGTTLLRLALNAHPRLAWVREFEYAVDLIGRDGTYPAVESYAAWLDTHRIFQSSDFEIRRHLAYPDVLRDFLGQQRAREGKPMVGATVHRHFDRLLRIWPDASFIHLVRDPRDVARSVVNMGWAGNTWTGIEGWLEAEQIWERMKVVVPADRRCEVRYEDFARWPKAELRRVSAFLGVSYDARMLEFPRFSTYRSPDPALIEQWRHKASKREIAWVEKRATEQMEALGYEHSGSRPARVGRLTRTALRLHDYWKRVSFRLRRNGLGLSLQDWFSRRFGLHAWQQSLRLRINSIEAEHLK